MGRGKSTTSSGRWSASTGQRPRKPSTSSSTTSDTARNQIRFVNLIIDELTQRGVVEPSRFYDSPYDGLAPTGPEALLDDVELERLFATLDRLRPLEDSQ